MHAFLILGDKAKIDEAVDNKVKSLGATRMDFVVSKIEDVRELQKTINLRLKEKTVITIRDFDIATEEAQNAFLKSLEEPQENLLFVLSASSTDSILDTIVSRVQIEIVRGGQENFEVEEDFLNSSTGGKLSILSKITNRQDAIAFLQKILFSSSKIIIISPEKAWVFAYIQDTLSKIKANGNVSIQFTCLVANLSSREDQTS